jgi:hypothetical protein
MVLARKGLGLTVQTLKKNFFSCSIVIVQKIVQIAGVFHTVGWYYNKKIGT